MSIRSRETHGITPILYVSLRINTWEGRVSRFQLIDKFEMENLPFFKVLPLLPSAIERMDPCRPPFIEAMFRSRQMPQFRQIVAMDSLSENVRLLFESTPIVVFLISGQVPNWLPEFVSKKPVVALTSFPKVIDSMRAIPGTHNVLLGGKQDISDIYGALSSLLLDMAGRRILPRRLFSLLQRAHNSTVFSDRPRLSFIPFQELLSPEKGKPAQLLLNRLSNNAEAQMASGEILGTLSIYDFLDRVKVACAAMALLEINRWDSQQDAGVPLEELQHIYKSVKEDITSQNNLGLLLNIGERLVLARPRGQLFLTIPAIRPNTKRFEASDFLYDPRMPIIPNASNTPEYDCDGLGLAKSMSQDSDKLQPKTPSSPILLQLTRRMVEVEDELLCSQTAMLAGGSFATPVMAPTSASLIFAAIDDLHTSLMANSNKAPRLFKAIQQQLTRSLPSEIADFMSRTNQPITLYSDLPYEWAQFNGAALCQQKAISRIPVSMNRWATLSAGLEGDLSIDASRSDRILLLNMLADDDPIRIESKRLEYFCNSNGLEIRYAAPRSKSEFRQALILYNPEVVIWDGHGSYNPKTDRLTMSIGAGQIDVDDLLSEPPFPKVWILSACQTSMTAALRGCLAKKLIARGAISVITTLAAINARMASSFICELIANIYLDHYRQNAKFLHQVFFRAQLVTSVLFDPLLPLLRKSEKDFRLASRLDEVFVEFSAWAENSGMEPLEFKWAAQQKLTEILKNRNLLVQQVNLKAAGHEFPESLLFSSLGSAPNIMLSKSRKLYL